ncbi:type II toxin-antitoxin system YoeB family toxin [Providencia sp. PROV149]
MSRFLIWTDQGWEDYLYRQTQDKKMLKRINNAH